MSYDPIPALEKAASDMGFAIAKIHVAFGPPGHFGYSTRQVQALSALYTAAAALHEALTGAPSAPLGKPQGDRA